MVYAGAAVAVCKPVSAPSRRGPEQKAHAAAAVRGAPRRSNGTAQLTQGLGAGY